VKVFVTGGTGLVGSHTIQRLCIHGHTVRALVRDDLGRRLVEDLGATAVFGSVEDTEAWAHAAGTDAIVHSAAIITTRGSWDTFQTININGAKNAALNAAGRGIRLVHISSVAVYGREPGSSSQQIDEDTKWVELPAREYYARSKRRAEEAIVEVMQKTGLPAVCLRPCVIYGERDRTFLPRVVRILRHGYAPLVGSGTNSLSIVYAGNVADAVLAAIEHPEVTGPVNVTNDGDVTQRAFFAAVGAALGRRTRFVRVPAAAAIALVVVRHLFRKLTAPNRYAGFGAPAVRFLTNNNPYTSQRARTELGWTPTTSPVAAIQRSVRWFNESR